MVDIDTYLQAVISLLVITAPFDPIKILFFGQAISDSGDDRRAAAFKVAIYSAVLLAGAAVIGQPFLYVLGIDLNAFRAVGGLVIALMGLEMLYGGERARRRERISVARAQKQVTNCSSL